MKVKAYRCTPNENNAGIGNAGIGAAWLALREPFGAPPPALSGAASGLLGVHLYAFVEAPCRKYPEGHKSAEGL